MALIGPDFKKEEGLEEVQWVSVNTLGKRKLAFDHDKIAQLGVERARAKLEYSTVATTFCNRIFTIAELRKVYESVWGVALDPGNFHRKVLENEGFLSETTKTISEGRGRPAKGYKAGNQTWLTHTIRR